MAKPRHVYKVSPGFTKRSTRWDGAARTWWDEWLSSGVLPALSSYNSLVSTGWGPDYALDRIKHGVHYIPTVEQPHYQDDPNSAGLTSQQLALLQRAAADEMPLCVEYDEIESALRIFLPFSSLSQGTSTSDYAAKLWRINPVSLSGTGASVDGTATVDLSADLPDLSSVPTDGTWALMVETTSGRRHSPIVGKDDGADTVTCSGSFTPTESGLVWQIGLLGDASIMSLIGARQWWEDVADKFTDMAWWTELQSTYPNPPFVQFHSNNEPIMAEVNGSPDPRDDLNWLDENGPGLTDQQVRDQIWTDQYPGGNVGWPTRYKWMFAQFKSKLTPGFGKLIFTGFGNDRELDLAKLNTNQDSAWEHYTWDGGSPAWYLNDFANDRLLDFKLGSVMSRHMARIPIDAWIRAQYNANWFREMSCWHGGTDMIDNMLTVRTDSSGDSCGYLTPERWRGDLLFGIYTLQPRIVRPFYGSTKTRAAYTCEGAVQGLSAAHTGGVSSTTIQLTDSPDLSGVIAGTAVWLNTTGNGEYSFVVSVDDGADTVTLEDAFTIASSSPVDYAIGGDWGNCISFWDTAYESIGKRYTNQDYYDVEEAAVELIWRDATVRNFYENGALLENGITWPARMFGTSPLSMPEVHPDWAVPNVMLDCSVNPSAPFSNLGDEDWWVYAAARKIGNSYLIYATAPRAREKGLVTDSEGNPAIQTDITFDGNTIENQAIPAKGVFINQTV